MSWVDEYSKQKKQEPLIPRRSYCYFQKNVDTSVKPTNTYETRPIDCARVKGYRNGVDK